MGGINKSKTLKKHNIFCECKCNLMVENVKQNKNGITLSQY